MKDMKLFSYSSSAYPSLFHQLINLPVSHTCSASSGCSCISSRNPNRQHFAFILIPVNFCGLCLLTFGFLLAPIVSSMSRSIQTGHHQLIFMMASEKYGYPMTIRIESRRPALWTLGIEYTVHFLYFIFAELGL